MPPNSPKRYLTLLLDLLEGEQASTVVVLCITVSVAWYMADAEVTGKPPVWILISLGVGVSGLVGIVNKCSKCLLDYVTSYFFPKQMKEHNEHNSEDS